MNPEGRIGIISTSAGNCMATIDRVADFGEAAGNFCDLGGSPYHKLIIESLVLMEKESNILVIMMNMFMNQPITIICEAIKESFDHNYVSKPVILRLKGLEMDKGREILESLVSSGRVFFE